MIYIYITANPEVLILLTCAEIGPRLQPQMQPFPRHVLQPAAGGRHKADPCWNLQVSAAIRCFHLE